MHFTQAREDDWTRAAVRWLIVLSVAMLLIAALAPPIPQPLEYHQFADRRGLLGIPNFLNTISSLAFLLAGFSGLKFLLQAEKRGTSGCRAFSDPRELWPILLFFWPWG
jgi:hypothetical protein